MSMRINDYGQDETGCGNQVVEGAALCRKYMMFVKEGDNSAD